MTALGVLGKSALFRAGLVTLLLTLGFDRVAEGATVANLREQATDEPDPEILLVHLLDEAEDVFKWMQEVRTWLPDAKVVFLSGKLDLQLLTGCFAAGAAGYLLENLSRDALHKSLNLVRAGEKVFPSELATIIGSFASKQVPEKIGKAGDPELSQREIEIFRLLGSGYSNKLIAAELDIAESTVKVHLKNILRKIRASNRTQAALWAMRHGIICSNQSDSVSGGPSANDGAPNDPGAEPDDHKAVSGCLAES